MSEIDTFRHEYVGDFFFIPVYHPLEDGTLGYRNAQDIHNKAQAAQGDMQTIEYCDWTNEDHRNFYERCCYIYSRYESKMSFEGWLLLNVGEFVFFALPSFTGRIRTWTSAFQVDSVNEPHFAGFSFPAKGMAPPWANCRFEVIDKADHKQSL